MKTITIRIVPYIVVLLLCSKAANAQSPSNLLVFQSDFGLKDAAVAEMKGVAVSVSPALKMFDITHEIPAYNIWESAYRLYQAAPYWPKGTVFVSIVDPGVGSDRKSVVLKTQSGHFFVSPDNGTLTLVAERLGIQEVRQIDERINRLKDSERSYTFHGRDVYAYTGARLAAGVITFEGVGAKLPNTVVQLDYQKPVFAGGVVKGNIPVLDIQYGNVWTNIDRTTFSKLGIAAGQRVAVEIRKGNEVIFSNYVTFGNTFSDVPEGQSIAYINSLLNFSLGINQGSFSEHHHVFSGPEWTITLKR
jgi:S-adenosylmethionine hydrolase